MSARRFNIEKLPVKVREKIEEIEWQDGTLDEDLAGIVWLKKGWCIIDDHSHCEAFTNKADLIYIINNMVEKEE